jgi:hypothetical protein
MHCAPPRKGRLASLPNPKNQPGGPLIAKPVFQTMRVLVVETAFCRDEDRPPFSLPFNR